MGRIIFFILTIIALQADGQSSIVIQFPDSLTNLRIRPSEFVVFTYQYQNDTIHYSEKPYRIKPPTYAVMANSAFGFIQFESHGDTGVSSHALFLITRYKSNEPRLYVDRNFNLDFNDDGPPYEFPFGATPVITLTHSNTRSVKVKLKLSHIVFKDQDQEKTVESFAHEGNPKSMKNKLLPARFWLTETRHNYKLSRPLETEQRIALMDWDNNGRFNDPTYDKIIVVEQDDRFVWNDVSSYDVGLDSIMFLNGQHFRVVKIDSLGRHIHLKGLTKQKNDLSQPLLMTGKVMPDFKFTLFNGKEVTWNGFRHKNKYILIDFWGTWCKPCVAQTPVLKALSDKYSERMEILGLAYQQNRERAIAYVNAHKLNWPQGFANERLVHELDISNFPYYILVDSKGIVVGHNIRLEDVPRLIK